MNIIYAIMLLVPASISVGIIIGYFVCKYWLKDDAKEWWNNPRNSDDFLNIPPKTDNRKHKNLN